MVQMILIVWNSCFLFWNSSLRSFGTWLKFSLSVQDRALLPCQSYWIQFSVQMWQEEDQEEEEEEEKEKEKEEEEEEEEKKDEEEE